MNENTSDISHFQGLAPKNILLVPLVLPSDNFRRHIFHIAEREREMEIFTINLYFPPPYDIGCLCDFVD